MTSPKANGEMKDFSAPAFASLAAPRPNFTMENLQ